jgi:hypothetical protein
MKFTAFVAALAAQLLIGFAALTAAQDTLPKGKSGMEFINHTDTQVRLWLDKGEYDQAESCELGKEGHCLLIVVPGPHVIHVTGEDGVVEKTVIVPAGDVVFFEIGVTETTPNPPPVKRTSLKQDTAVVIGDYNFELNYPNGNNLVGTFNFLNGDVIATFHQQYEGKVEKGSYTMLAERTGLMTFENGGVLIKFTVNNDQTLTLSLRYAAQGNSGPTVPGTATPMR